jgi:hypothetical protein
MMKRDGVPVELIVKVLRRSAALKGETPDALGQILSFITHFLGANSYDLSSRIPREFVDQTYAVAHGVSGAGMVALPNGINANSN